MTYDLSQLTSAQLLKLNADSTEELRRRGIVRSYNNPVADVSELLFCRAFGWQLSSKSNPAADATDLDGKLYQIKGRRLTQASRQLGVMRNLKAGGFHSLAGVLFEPDYSVKRAALIPHNVVLEKAKYRAHVNASVFHLTDAVWKEPGVRDVTDELRNVIL
jgi:hypothetical protein